MQDMRLRPAPVSASTPVRSVAAQFAYRTLAVTGMLGLAMVAPVVASAGTPARVAKHISAVIGTKILTVICASAVCCRDPVVEYIRGNGESKAFHSNCSMRVHTAGDRQLGTLFTPSDIRAKQNPKHNCRRRYGRLPGRL